MFRTAPVTVHVERVSVYRTSSGGEAVTADDGPGAVVVGQSGDVSVMLADRRIVTVWPDGTVTLAPPGVSRGDDEKAISFALPTEAAIRAAVDNPRDVTIKVSGTFV